MRATHLRVLLPLTTPYRQATTFVTARFKHLVGTDPGIEVRLRKFY